MRKISVIGLILLLSGFVLAARPGVTLHGYVIDNACSARANSADGLEKVKNHTTKCALMPPCQKSGYAVLADGKLYKLDDAGNQKVIEILKNTKTDKGVAVAVEGSVDGDTIHVTKITEEKGQ